MNDDTMNNDQDTLATPPAELFELLADRAAFGLDETEEARLETLLGEHRWVREDCIDEVAAGVAREARDGCGVVATCGVTCHGAGMMPGTSPTAREPERLA